MVGLKITYRSNQTASLARPRRARRGPDIPCQGRNSSGVYLVNIRATGIVFPVIGIAVGGLGAAVPGAVFLTLLQTRIQ
jgi:hypothetical protein